MPAFIIYCRNGHLRTAENTAITREGSRRCLDCKHKINDARLAPDAFLAVRFWGKVDKTGGCWLWGAHKNALGYGTFRLGTKMILAHRMSFHLASGSPVPAELLVMPLCDNPSCVNPAHLSLGTPKDNAVDKINKGRDHNQQKTHCRNGHPYSPENTQWQSNGRRACRVCRRKQGREYACKKRARAADLTTLKAA